MKNCVVKLHVGSIVKTSLVDLKEPLFQTTCAVHQHNETETNIEANT